MSTMPAVKPQHRPRGEGALARLRLRKGLSQAALAGLAGISRIALMSLESGKVGVPMPGTIANLARVLEADPLSVAVAIAQDYATHNPPRRKRRR